MPFIFDPKYFGLTILFFVTEVVIALFVNDSVVRPFVGDVLVVILIYCFVRSFFAVNFLKAAVGVLLFACLIEILQYVDYVRILGLENNRILATVMGRTFAWSDFLAYLTGFALIVLTESLTGRAPVSTQPENCD